MKPTNNKHTMKKKLLFVGLDVHAKSITIGLAEGGGETPGEARVYGTIANDLHALEKVLAKLKKAHSGAELRVCYEAGPTGFVIARRLGQLKVHCMVVAPSLIPVRSGERIKTDRRDALKLARLLRAGAIVAFLNVADRFHHRVFHVFHASSFGFKMTVGDFKLHGFASFGMSERSSWSEGQFQRLKSPRHPKPGLAAALQFGFGGSHGMFQLLTCLAKGDTIATCQIERCHREAVCELGGAPWASSGFQQFAACSEGDRCCDEGDRSCDRELFQESFG